MWSPSLPVVDQKDFGACETRVFHLKISPCPVSHDSMHLGSFLVDGEEWVQLTVRKTGEKTALEVSWMVNRKMLSLQRTSIIFC